MHDEFLHRLRKEPRPEFVARLRAHLRRQSEIRFRRRPLSQVRSLLVLLLLGGTAFAFTLAVRGVPVQLLGLFHHKASPVASARTSSEAPAPNVGTPTSPAPVNDLPSSSVQSGSSAPAPNVSAPTSPAALNALPSSSAQSGGAAPAPPAAGPWQYFLRRDSAPLLQGWIHQGLPAGWQVHGGVLSKNGLVEDLESTQTYRDFVLELQWKISAGGDSGIFYRGTHEYPRIWLTGPEYQLVDDSYVGPNRLVATGAVFGIYPSPAGVVHPPGQWNSTRIVVLGNHVEYWLNGQRIISYTLGSDDWMLRVRDSKFATVRDYGRATEGLIGLQGTNNGSLEVRRMRIKVLP